MRIRDLVQCPECRRVVAMHGKLVADHAKRAFAWNRCPGSGRVLPA